MQQDILAFFSRSKDLPAGKGANEYVETSELYDELNAIKDWRKVLSNFHVSTKSFIYENKTYRTIEHALQAYKIALFDHEKAYEFCVESGSTLGISGCGLDAQKQRKIVILDSTKLAEWNMIKDKVMNEASILKYNACELSQKVLKATKNAKLMHIMSRQKPIHFVHLENIRANL